MDVAAFPGGGLGPPRVWALTGREEELRLCEQCLFGEGARGIFVTGAAGVGKTRLASEALSRAVGAGRATAQATATEAARPIPLGALAQLLPPELLRAPTTLDLLARAEVAVARGRQDVPLILWVDDAHLLDAASAMLVHRLVVGRGAAVVLTVRTGEPLSDALTALWKDHGCAYLELQPLARAQVRELVESELGGPVDGRTEHALWEASRGVPLFLRELVLEGLGRQVLRRELDLWSWHGELAFGRRLGELVRERIGVLLLEQRETLELVAFGEPLPVAWLRVPEAADDLVRRGVLQAVPDGRRLELRFAHPLYGEVVRAEVPATRAGRIQRHLADALERSGAPLGGDLLRLAEWRLAGGGEIASERLVAAAARAQLSYAPALAERLACAAVDRGGGAVARHGVARALVAQGRYEEAEALLAALEGEALEHGERVLVAETHARLLAGPLGRADEASRVVAEAAAAVADESSRAKLALIEGWIRFRRGDPAQAFAAVARSLDAPGVEATTRLVAAAFATQTLAQAGRSLAALVISDRWLRDAASGDVDRRVRADYAFARAVALLFAGRTGEAEDKAVELYDETVAHNDIERLGLDAWLCGIVALHSGRVARSRRFLHESASVLRELDPRGMLPWALAMVAQSAGQGGDAEEANWAVAEAEVAAASGRWIYSPGIAVGQAWASAAEGAVSDAVRSALAGAEMALERGQLTAAVWNFHDAARLGGTERAAEQLAELVGDVEGPWVRACADHAAALANADGPALEEAGRQFEALGCWLYAAEALNEAATRFREAGFDSRARSCSARASSFRARCAGARTPSLRSPSVADELTRREHEIATLAARGLSNKAIAARLVVSVRTVENQLQRAYAKLGIQGRTQLGVLLEPQEME